MVENKIEHDSTWLIDKIHRGYHPIISRSLNNKVAVIFIALILLAGAGFTFAGMGGVFIPDLDEGNIAMQALLEPGSSLSECVEVSQKVENILLDNFREVKTEVARVGVGDGGTGPVAVDSAYL